MESYFCSFFIILPISLLSRSLSSLTKVINCQELKVLHHLVIIFSLKNSIINYWTWTLGTKLCRVSMLRDSLWSPEPAKLPQEAELYSCSVIPTHRERSDDWMSLLSDLRHVEQSLNELDSSCITKIQWLLTFVVSKFCTSTIRFIQIL